MNKMLRDALHLLIYMILRFFFSRFFLALFLFHSTINNSKALNL